MPRGPLLLFRPPPCCCCPAPLPCACAGLHLHLSNSHACPLPLNAAAGVVKYGQPLSLDDKIKVDLIVVGSVAVDPETGCRCGGWCLLML